MQVRPDSLPGILFLPVALVWLAVVSGTTAAPKTIQWNNGSGSGEWNTTATNWTVNPYADGDTVQFLANNGTANTTVFIGLNGVPGTVSPAGMTYNYLAGTITFIGGDITGAANIIAPDDGGFTFKNGTATGLSFSGGACVGTANGKGTLTYAPTNGITVRFGSGFVTNPVIATGGTFTFNPSIPMTLATRFNITSSNFTLNGNANANFTGDIHLASSAGLLYGANNASSNQTVYLDGATGTLTVSAPSSGVQYGFNGAIYGPTATLNLWSGASASAAPNGIWTDYRSGVTATNAWNVKNVNTMGGLLYVANADAVFSLLRNNGGVVTILNGNLAASSGVSQDTVSGAFNTGPADYLLTSGAGGNNVARIAGDTLNVTGGGTISGTNGILFGNTLNINQGSIQGAVAVGGPRKTDGVLFKFTTANLNPLGTLSTSGKVNALNFNLNGGTLQANASPVWADTTTVRSAASTVTATGNLTGNASTRSAGATALFRGANLGGSAKATFTSGTTLTGGLFPWALADASDTGAGTTFAAYTAAGVVPQAAYDATDSLGNPGNVDLTAANAIAAGDPDRTVNALRLSSGGGVTIDSARKLTVASGGILAMAGNTGFTGGTLAFGAAEGIVHTLGDLTVSSSVTGTNGLTKDGAGILTLSGANALGNSATWLNAGTLVLGANNALGTNTLTVQPGSVFDMAGFTQTVGGLSDNAGQAVGGVVTNSGSATSLTINNTGAQTFSGTIAGALSLVKSGAGSQTLNASNSNSGGMILNAGTLGLGSDSALSYGGLTIAGGTIQGANGARTITNALTVSGDFAIGGASDLTLTAPIQIAAATRTITVNNTGLTTLSGGLSQDIAGRGFTKAGAGTLVVPASTYSGATTVSDGALRANDGSGLPAASLLVFNGGNAAVLESAGVFARMLGAAAGNVQWLGNGGFAAKGAPLAVQLNGGGSVTWASGSFVPDTKYLNLESLTADDAVKIQNDINLNSGNRVINVVDNPGSTNDYAEISGVIANGSITKANSGTLRLSGANSYTGGTYFVNTLNNPNGTIQLNSPSSIGTGPLVFSYGTIATLENISGGPLVLPNRIGDNNGGGKTVNLRGGDFTLSGTLDNIGGGNGIFTLNGGNGVTITLTGTNKWATTTLAAATTTASPTTFVLAGTNNGNGYFNAVGPNVTVAVAVNNALGAAGLTNLMNGSGDTLIALNGPRTLAGTHQYAAYSETHYFGGTNNITLNGSVISYNANASCAFNVYNTGLTTFGGEVKGTLLASGNGSDTTWIKQGAGTLCFSGTNTYNFRTQIDAGALRAINGIGLSSNSFLSLNGGVLESAGTFARALGAKPAAATSVTNQFRWMANGGFSAFGGPLTVDINNDGAGAAPLVWNSTANFIGNSTLILSSTGASSVVTMVDNINLNAAARTIQVDDNPATTDDYAVISGILSGGVGSAINKTGAGTLFLNGANSFTGTTTVVAGAIGGSGSLPGNLVLNPGTRFDAVIGQTLSVSNLTIGANCSLNVANKGGGTIILYSGTCTGAFTNLIGLNNRSVSYKTPGRIQIVTFGSILKIF